MMLCNLKHVTTKVGHWPRLAQRQIFCSRRRQQQPQMVEKVKPFEEMPEVKGLPLIGTALDYSPVRGFQTQYLHKLFLKRHKQYGDIFREKVPGLGYVVYCRSTEDTEAMFRNEGKMPKRTTILGLTRVRERMGIPDSSFNLTGEEWHKFRSVFNPLLLQNKMVWKYVAQQRAVCQDLVSYIKRNMDSNGEVPDLDGIFSRWAFEMSGTFVLNQRLGLLNDNPEKKMTEVSDGLAMMMTFMADSTFGLQLWRYFDTKQIKEVTDGQIEAYKTLKYLIDNAMNSESRTGSTILEQIMECPLLTKDEQYLAMYDVLGASIETTSKAISLIIYSLTLREDVQEKLREEIRMLPTGEGLTGRVVDKMEYMTAFLKESMRMFPLSVAFGRSYDKDLVLSGYTVPAGTEITNTSNSTQNMSEKYFSEPESFLPERWLKSDGSRIENKFVSTGGFGFGAKACPGRRFAMQEIRLLLIELLNEYKVEYHYKPIVAIFRGTGAPSEESRFTFVPLSKKD